MSCWNVLSTQAPSGGRSRPRPGFPQPKKDGVDQTAGRAKDALRTPRCCCTVACTLCTGIDESCRDVVGEEAAVFLVRAAGRLTVAVGLPAGGRGNGGRDGGAAGPGIGCVGVGGSELGVGSEIATHASEPISKGTSLQRVIADPVPRP